MSTGYWRRILHVDLSQNRVWTEEPDDAFYRKHMGGRAMIAHYLLTETPSGIDAYDPANRLIFALGALTGTPVPGAGRHSVGAKSPMSGGFGESEAGGFWGAELKKAGWDGIVIKGKASKPVYLWINDQTVEIRDASHLWGKLTDDVESRIREDHGDKWIRIAQTGIAGENLVRYACVMNDLNEAAGRTGLGAVMGSKNLKAVAVRGKRMVPMADASTHKETAKWVSSTMDEVHYNFHHFGTGAALADKQLNGHLIAFNFRDGQWDSVEQVQKIDAKTIATTVREKMDGCYACSVRCKKRVRIDSAGVRPEFGGPEYETIGAIGTNVGVDDLIQVCKANQWLNLVGLDTISFGCTLAWAMECYELGLLTEADTGGLALKWGDGELLNDMVLKVARREGFGDVLAEGALRASRKIGRDTEKYVVHVKGLEMAMHDPRAMAVMRLNYPVTPTGGDHTGGAHHRTSNRNTIGLCQFLQYDEEKVTRLLNGATGWDTTVAEIENQSSRGLTMARLYNLREGLSRQDDVFPPRIHEAIRKGPLSDHVLTREQVSQETEEYYQRHGWDRVNGIPLAETLERQGLRMYSGFLGDRVPTDDGRVAVGARGSRAPEHVEE
ncbi:MAG: aldehyde ferredoxin oxidoreductase [Chloroflexota bacterium]|nr:MAG: aldehyde ferredoxin oxidoreductase [Chloroflexota bacterium]